MDPDATLAALLEALTENDRTSAILHATNLAAWISRGGYLPQPTKNLINHALVSPKPAADWHEEAGNVLWWKFPVSEPPYVGSPLDSEWEEGYYTHWTPLPQVWDWDGNIRRPKDESGDAK